MNKKKRRSSKQNVHQTVRLVPDITNMNFFKSMSFKSGEKQEIYTNNGKKTSRRLAETEPTARSRNRKARMNRPVWSLPCGMLLRHNLGGSFIIFFLLSWLFKTGFWQEQKDHKAGRRSGRRRGRWSGVPWLAVGSQCRPPVLYNYSLSNIRGGSPGSTACCSRTAQDTTTTTPPAISQAPFVTTELHVTQLFNSHHPPQ